MSAEVILAAVLALLFFGTAALSIVEYQLVRQHGRLLLRVDAVELLVDGARPQILAPFLTESLEVGAAVPSFDGWDLDDSAISEAMLRGRRTLLVHWNPHCGFCRTLAPDLAGRQPLLDRRGVRLVLASYGDPEANRALLAQHGLECRVLLQPAGDPLPAFRGIGTPAAYLLATDLRVVAPLAEGAQRVLALADDIVAPEGAGRKRLQTERPLATSRIERNGLAAGAIVPSFRLPTVDGGRVAAEDYRGKRLLVVFTDPDCGPCDAIAPLLVELHRRTDPDELAILAIGRGELGANASKARLHGFRFPVAVQRSWEVSRQFGIFATPVAFLVGTDGELVRGVARGAEELTSLLDELAGVRKEAHDGLLVR